MQLFFYLDVLTRLDEIKIACEAIKGFNKPIIPFQYVDLKKTTSPEILKGDVVDIILKQPGDIESILYELKSLQKDYEEKLFQTVSNKKNKK